MGLFNNFFSKSNQKKDPSKGKPPVYGGDGTSKENAAVVNCASMSLANRLINDFISKKHGELEKDWNRNIEYFLNSEESENPRIRVISIECSDGSNHEYYFDVSRPMGVANKMLGFE